jgi:hypothetical protein
VVVRRVLELHVIGWSEISFGYTFDYFWFLKSAAVCAGLVAYHAFSSYLIIRPFVLDW